MATAGISVSRERIDALPFPHAARDALLALDAPRQNKIPRAKSLAVVCAFHALGFLLTPRHVFSSNLGISLFTVIQALTWSSLIMYGIGLSRRIRRITMPAA